MPTVLPPARTELSAPFPNPTNAVARTGMGKLWDYVTNLLGTAGTQAGALTALGAVAKAGDTLTGAINEARATVVGNATTSDIWGATSANSIDLTGVITYTNFPAAPQAGAKRRLYPATGAVFTNAGAFGIVGNANYTVPAGGSVDVEAITTTTFRLAPLNADGRALVGALDAGPIQGAFRNLAGSAPGTSAVVTYTIDELATGDGAGNYQTTRAWNSTITMTSAGAGGLDTGTVAASTWYYAYGITKPDGTKGLIASLNSTGPSFANAAGYTKWARIGSLRTDGTANKYPFPFKQQGRGIDYAPAAGTNLTSFPTIASGVAGFPTAASLGSFVPPTAAKFGGFVTYVTASSNVYLSSNQTDQMVNIGAGAGNGTVPLFATIQGPNIYYGSSGAGNSAKIYGWEDNL